MKVTIDQLFRTRPHLQALRADRLPANTKYWVGRIGDAADSALKDFELKRSDLVRKFGEPVRFDPMPPIMQNGIEVPQPPMRVVLTEQEDLDKPHAIDVPPERMAEFQVEGQKLMLEEVELQFDGKPFNPIKLSAFDNVDVSADIAALSWMIVAE